MSLAGTHRTLSTFRRLAAGLLAAGLLAGLSTTASAQLGAGSGNAPAQAQAVKLEPPTADLRSEEGGNLWQTAFMVLIVMLVIGANLIPTKRGHQE